MWLWHFSGKSEGSEGVHNQVDPEKLDSLEWSSLHESGAEEYSQEGVDIDGQLELEESLDVIEDVSSPLTSLDD